MGLIIITGASSGIGRFLYERLAEISDDKIIGLYNHSAIYDENYYKVDVTNIDEVRDFVHKVSHISSKISLINCAGISYNAYGHKADLIKWSQVIEVNLIGAFNIIHELLPIMRNNNWGRIINFSSVVAKYPTPGVSAYSASKAALWGLTKSLSIENASKGITINNINLGYTEAGMGIKDVPPAFKSSILDKIPLKRFCSKEEVYETVRYILNNAYLTGSSIDLNGGLV